MTVTLNVSRFPGFGATAIADALAGGSTGLDHGSVTNGSDTVEERIYLSHDGTNEITDVSFYCAQYSGVYGGGASAAADFAEMIAWGADADKSLRLDNDDDGVYEYYLHTGVMDSSGNAEPLDSASGGGSTPDDIGPDPNYCAVRFKISVPASEDTAGIRQMDIVVRYTYTS